MQWDNQQDRARFLGAFNALTEVFGKEVSEGLPKFYFSCFEDYGVEVVAQGMHKAAMELKFFPRPVELKELIEGPKEDLTVKAAVWAQKVLEAASDHGSRANPQFSDPVVNAVIKHKFGSWGAVCMTPVDSHKWFKRDFEKAYVEFAERGMELHEPLKGLNSTAQPIMIGESGQSLKAISSGGHGKAKGLISNLVAKKVANYD